MSTERVYRIGDVEVIRGPSWVVSRFPDGREVHAHGDGSEFQEACALSLGYDSPEQMNRDHDAAHHLLAVIAGKPYSPTLRGVAEGEYVPREVSDAEEVLVMLLQRVSQVGLDGVLEDYAVP